MYMYTTLTLTFYSGHVFYPLLSCMYRNSYHCSSPVLVTHTHNSAYCCSLCLSYPLTRNPPLYDTTLTPGLSHTPSRSPTHPRTRVYRIVHCILLFQYSHSFYVPPLSLTHTLFLSCLRCSLSLSVTYARRHHLSPSCLRSRSLLLLCVKKWNDICNMYMYM